MKMLARLFDKTPAFDDFTLLIFYLPNSRLLVFSLPKPSHQNISPIMSSNVGLSTPRGSGTSGYVQRNLSHLKPRDAAAPYTKDRDLLQHRQRQPDKDILEHDRKREIEVKVFELRDKLEEEEYVHTLTPPSEFSKLIHEQSRRRRNRGPMHRPTQEAPSRTSRQELHHQCKRSQITPGP